MSAVGKYFTGVSKSITKIADTMGVGYYSGTSAKIIVNAVNKCYNLNAQQLGGWVSLDGVYTYLSNGIVPIGCFQANVWDENESNNQGHTVIICGYSASTQGSFLRVMDPNFNSYCMVFSIATPDGLYETYAFSYGNVDFYWLDTVLCGK